MLEISFANSDELLRGRQLLQKNNIACGQGSAYRNLSVDSDDKRLIAKLLKKDRIKCSVAVIT